MNRKQFMRDMGRYYDRLIKPYLPGNETAQRIHDAIVFGEHPDPAPECKCHSGPGYYDKHNCPIHSSKDPAPPLRARVAKELGWSRISELDYGWHGFNPIDDLLVTEIPPYDTDRDLAIGAFWEYLAKLGLSVYGAISFGAHGQGQIHLGRIILNFEYIKFGEVPPEKLCEAIVAHAEAK